MQQNGRTTFGHQQYAIRPDSKFIMTPVYERWREYSTCIRCFNSSITVSIQQSANVEYSGLFFISFFHAGDQADILLFNLLFCSALLKYLLSTKTNPTNEVVVWSPRNWRLRKVPCKCAIVQPREGLREGKVRQSANMKAYWRKHRCMTFWYSRDKTV